MFEGKCPHVMCVVIEHNQIKLIARDARNRRRPYIKMQNMEGKHAKAGRAAKSQMGVLAQAIGVGRRLGEPNREVIGDQTERGVAEALVPQGGVGETGEGMVRRKRGAPRGRDHHQNHSRGSPPWFEDP